MTDKKMLADEDRPLKMNPRYEVVRKTPDEMNSLVEDQPGAEPVRRERPRPA